MASASSIHNPQGRVYTMRETEIQLRFDDSTWETAAVEEVASDRFRLIDTPLFAPEPLHPGDLILGERLADGTVRFVRLLAREAQRHYSWVLSREFAESPEFARYKAAVEAAGGTWESLFGGIFYVHLPESSSFDAETELASHIKDSGIR
jgi:hypothetical protein